jgi:ribonuclease Z
MKVQGIEIKGRSVSGYATAIALPEYSLCFDCGMAIHHAVQSKYVAISHGHLDHFGGVARHAYIRNMTGMSASTFLVPPVLKSRVDQVLQFWAEVQEARKAPSVTRVLSENSTSQKVGKYRVVKAFDTDHRITSQGYVLVETRKRLKPKYIGTPGAELGRLRREGVEFEDKFEIPLVGYTGDTRYSLYNQYKPRARVFIAECTFIDQMVTLEKTHKKGHTHLDELARRPEIFDEVGTLVLCHFSKRYVNRDIEAAIAKLPKCLREKTTFLPVNK